jgi:hypothetical protein
VSSPLAIATVTATMLDMLNDGLVNNDFASVGSYRVSAMPPDRVTTGTQEPNQLNLFLYRVTPNTGWRNHAQPSHGTNGDRYTNPPLALDLHYLLTAYGQQDLAAEILLGYAMELLHDARVLTRGAIRRALGPANPVTQALALTDADGRTAADLADQVEQIKIAPNYLSAEELSKLWTAMQARYRPSMAYVVSVVLIQGVKPTRTPLPVLARGKDDTGVSSSPKLGPPTPTLPTLLAITIRGGDGKRKSSAELGDRLELDGYNLAAGAGGKVLAIFGHALLATAIEREVDAASSDTRAVVILPDPTTDAAAASDWPAGSWRVSLRIERVGKPVRVTGALPFDLAPRIVSALPIHAARAGDGSLAVQLDVVPEVWPGQRAFLLLGGDGHAAAPIASKTGTLDVAIAHAEPTEAPVPVRVRVDGVDSVLVRDIDVRPPTFDPAQTIEIT